MRVRILVTVILAGALYGVTPNPAQDAQKDLHRAQELEKAGHVEQAIPIYLRVLKGEPENVEANLALGRAYFQNGQAAQAAQSFERALQSQPGNADTVEWLGKSYLKAGDPEKTVDLISREDSLANHYAWAHLLLARAFDAQDKLDEARGELHRALAIDPHSRGAHFALGFIAWTTRDLETAERQFRMEINLDSQEALPYYYLIETLELEGKLDEAETVLKMMGRECSDTYVYHYSVGKLVEYRGNFEAARSEFREAIRLDPKRPEAYYHLALMLQKLGEAAPARREFELANKMRLDMKTGSGQGMGRMRPHLPDVD